VSEKVTVSTTTAEASMTEIFSPLLASLPVYTALALPPYVVWKRARSGDNTKKPWAGMLVPAGSVAVTPPNVHPDTSTGLDVVLASSRNSSESRSESGLYISSLITTSPGAAPAAGEAPTVTQARVAETTAIARPATGRAATWESRIAAPFPSGLRGHPLRVVAVTLGGPLTPVKGKNWGKMGGAA